VSSGAQAVTDDILRTTGLALDVETFLFGTDDPHFLARYAQEQHVIEQLGRAWPRCLKHGRHPMVPEHESLSWCCSIDGTVLVVIGSLTEEGPDPDVADNLVRWWLNQYGFGAIAHRDGDAWVHFSAIEGDGYRELKEDQLVEFEESSGPMHGGYRLATRVRRIG
jgi:CspA family cold shock protein